jgi:exopolysaccharide production protein ExoY
MLPKLVNRETSDPDLGRQRAKNFFALDGLSEVNRQERDDGPPAFFYAQWGKRLCDVVGAVLLLLGAWPLILLLLLLVELDGGKPIFSHPRVGKDGRIFRCFKIRTMVADGEARLNDILSNDPAAAAEWARDFKLRNDPRITRLGRFIRATSLDELPQLWNVVRGEMSLVGPRPVTEAEIPLYGHCATAYRSVRPGMTGLWQVSGRNSLSFPERVELDRTYVMCLSFTEDLRILIRTLPAVLRVTGC